MKETFNNIISSKSFDKIGSRKVIQSKNFKNEVIRSHDIHDLMGLAFSRLTFLNCNFMDIDFRHTLWIFCEFTNCNFTETIFLRSELQDCNFKNCKIFQSDFVKANVNESNFIDCQYQIDSLAAAVFTECQFFEPKFNKTSFVSLNSLTLIRSKICNSKKCIEANSFDDLEEIVKTLDLKD